MKHIHKETKQKDGLYWTPIGGNNPDILDGNSHIYSCKHTHKNGKQKKSSILIDAGSFWGIESFGIDELNAVIPNTLPFLSKNGEKNKNEAEALFLTHAHRDHIEAIPEYIKMGYKLPKIYAAPYTMAMVKKTLAKHRVPIKKWPEMENIKAGKTISIGDMNIEAIAVTHSIPDALGFVIKTPDSTIFHSGDLKADQTLAFGKPTDFKRLEEISKDGIDAMMIDSSDATTAGFSRNEEDVREAYKKLVKKHSKGKIIVTCATHHLNRIASIAKAAAESGRTVVLDGCSDQRLHMNGLKKAGIDLTKEIKGLKILDGRSKKAKNLPDEKTLIITSTGWGQKDAPLQRAANNNYDGFDISSKDTVIIEAFGKEWIEKSLEGIKKPLEAKGVKIITGDDEPDIYGSGHGQKEDIKLIHKTVNPKVTIPMHCTDKICNNFLQMAKEENINTGGIVPKNATTLRITKTDGVEVISKEQALWIGVRTISEDKSIGIRIPQNITAKTIEHLSKRSDEARKKIAELKTKNEKTKHFHLIKALYKER